MTSLLQGRDSRLALLKLPDSKGQEVRYLLQPIPCDYGGMGFRLVKCVQPPEVYDVLVHPDPAEASCSCLGFESHGHCKHHRELARLVAEGKL